MSALQVGYVVKFLSILSLLSWLQYFFSDDDADTTESKADDAGLVN